MGRSCRVGLLGLAFGGEPALLGGEADGRRGAQLELDQLAPVRAGHIGALRVLAQAKLDQTLLERVDLDPEAELVDQLLAGSLRFRYRSMAACRDDLERFLHGEPLEVARLCDPQGRTLVELGARVVVGSAPRCEAVLAGADPLAPYALLAGADPQHAQIRRKAEGYELRDLRSKGGTLRGAERVERPVFLRDGDLLRFGSALAIVRDPRDRADVPPFLRAPRRTQLDRESALVLLALGDPRALTLAAEWAAPDLGLLAEAKQRLAPLWPVPGLDDALAAEQARWASWLVGQATPEAWVARWEHERPELSEQCAPPTPPAELALEASAGEARIIVASLSFENASASSIVGKTIRIGLGS